MNEDKEMVFGEGDVSIEIPNPMSIDNKSFNADYYGAWVAGQLFSMLDPVQHTNADETANMVCKRVKTFVSKVQGMFGGAFS